MAAARIPARDQREILTSRAADGEDVVGQLLGAPRPPTALLVEADDLAMRVLAALWRVGLRTPQDLSVVGFDDHAMAETFGLTTMAQPVAELATGLLGWRWPWPPVRHRDAGWSPCRPIWSSAAPPVGRAQRKHYAWIGLPGAPAGSGRRRRCPTGSEGDAAQGDPVPAGHPAGGAAGPRRRRPPGDHADLHARPDAGYRRRVLSTGSEPATLQLVAWLAVHRIRVLLPVLSHPVGGRMERPAWAPYEGPDRLWSGAYGILEPTGESLPSEQLPEAELIICAGLAANRQGDRLGRGGGWYDRALVTPRRARRSGCC